MCFEKIILVHLSSCISCAFSRHTRPPIDMQALIAYGYAISQAFWGLIANCRVYVAMLKSPIKKMLNNVIVCFTDVLSSDVLTPKVK
jgi:hypothetical protein